MRKGWTIVAVFMAVCSSALVLQVLDLDAPLPTPVRAGCQSVIAGPPDVQFSATDSGAESRQVTRIAVDEVDPSQRGRLGRRVALVGVLHVEFELANVYTTQQLWFRLVDPDHTDKVDSTVLLNLTFFGPGEAYFVEHRRDLGDRCAVVEGVYDATLVQVFPSASPVRIGILRPVYRLSIWSAPRFPVIASALLKESMVWEMR